MDFPLIDPFSLVAPASSGPPGPAAPAPRKPALYCRTTHVTLWNDETGRFETTLIEEGVPPGSA